uniref:Acyl carrier protein n=1 Tax=Alexandrium monilatum TaxID=311494 RepID=A0A7S4VL27_9DINO|mmetsp:Transcript_100730/g.300465  ORF Transcript_100730/g.300465 Transcript_100730/m.300465 type:complete len:141 (-) Transcript_100730:222-644(-)
MAASTQSRRTLGAALLGAVLVVACWRSLPFTGAGELQTLEMTFVAGPRIMQRRLRSPMVLLRAASDDTMAKVADIIADQLGVDKVKVTREATLTELGADSLDIVESVMALEEAFDIELPDEETTALKNVGDVANLIEKKL